MRVSRRLECLALAFAWLVALPTLAVRPAAPGTPQIDKLRAAAQEGTFLQRAAAVFALGELGDPSQLAFLEALEPPDLDAGDYARAHCMALVKLRRPGPEAPVADAQYLLDLLGPHVPECLVESNLNPFWKGKPLPPEHRARVLVPIRSWAMEELVRTGEEWVWPHVEATLAGPEWDTWMPERRETLRAKLDHSARGIDGLLDAVTREDRTLLSWAHRELRSGVGRDEKIVAALEEFMDRLEAEYMELARSDPEAARRFALQWGMIYTEALVTIVYCGGPDRMGENRVIQRMIVTHAAMQRKRAGRRHAP